VGIKDNENTNKNGWSEYSRLVLSKLDELHSDTKEIKSSIDVVNDRLTKLEARQEDLVDIEVWQKEVYSAWSPVQMKEAKDELYKQKDKWTGAWFVFVTIQIIWGILIVFKDKIFK
jgi:hypothetical protein